MWQFLRELPLTALRATADLLEWLMVSSWAPLMESEDEPRSWWRTLARIPARFLAWLFRMGVSAVAFPVAALFLPPTRRNCYLRGLPAMLAMGAFLAALAIHAYFHDRILNRYVSKVQSAFSKGLVADAQPLSTRVAFDAMRDKPERVFLYSIVRQQSGDTEGYEAILEGLAPDDLEGLPEAHLARAIDLARAIRIDRASKVQVESLRWHLTHCGKADNEQMHSLWSLYHRANQDWEQAESSLRAASRVNPMYLLQLSEFLMERGKSAEADRVLNDAIKSISAKLSENPLSKALRLELVVALNRLKRSEDAERVLIAGVQLHRDEEMRQALSDFYLMLYEEEREASGPVRVQLSRLMQALRAQPNSARVYRACTECFVRHGVGPERETLERALEASMVEGGSVAIAHFMMGAERILRAWPPAETLDSSRALAMERDGTLNQAVWHLKQAIALDRGFASVCNNYARVLLFGSERSPHAARAMVSAASESDPNVAAYWDTLGESWSLIGEVQRSNEAFGEALRLEPNATRQERLEREKERLVSLPEPPSGG